MAEASRPHTFSHTWLLFRAVGVLGVSYATALLMFLLVEARLPPSLLRCVSLLRSPVHPPLASGRCSGSAGESTLPCWCAEARPNRA